MKLDYQYISKLLDSALKNDSNAYAELFAATYPSIYTFSCTFLQDEELAKETLTKTYVQAFSSLYQIHDNNIFVLWLLKINCLICLEYKPIEKPIQIDNANYSISQLINLPLSESLSLIMKYHSHLNYFTIAKIMDISISRVNQSIANGKERLMSI